MKLVVKDSVHQNDALVSKLYINDEFACYVLEDWPEGVDHRVPRGGPYKMVFRNEGTVNAIYSQDKDFKSFHKGMLHILVPGRLYILIHCGNSPEDTLGCLLVGSSNNEFGKVEQSRVAYARVYPKIADALSKGEEVTIYYDNKIKI